MQPRRLAVVEGVVQGVGFRPFVARLAQELGLCGFVRNEGRAACIEVEGPSDILDRFAFRLLHELPAPGRITRASWQARPPLGRPGFEIEASSSTDLRQLTIPPDLATCLACVLEVEDPEQRRHGYPFTNCAQCGPRFSIVRELPYDRARTSMADFALCEACLAQYQSQSDRRYHAQPIACPACGPQLRLLASNNAPLAHGAPALLATGSALRRGEIIALKGVGGFQLLVDASDAAAVARLRERKRRPQQPFAVMVRDLAAARALAELDSCEVDALLGSAAPIVLARKRAHSALADQVAPANDRVGVMLPTTALHHLLLRALPFPLVCTSGNLHQEPIARDDAEAFQHLSAIADAFLTHDRPIVHRIDDSVVQAACGRARVLRVGRGLGPLQLPLPSATRGLLCAGSHLNNAPAATLDGDVVLWPHVGDLDSAAAEDAFCATTAELSRFLALPPRRLACDAHPEYASTRWAEASSIPHVAVQHHHAHVAACLAEHGVDSALGVVFDGSGLGPDGTLWGGEFLRVQPGGFTRVAHLRAFALPGGDAAARDGRRALAGACIEAGVPLPAIARPFAELAASARLSPRTSSAGRLFDALAAWLGVCERSSFEGQAALALEHCARGAVPTYPFDLRGPLLDWTPMWRALATELGDPVRAAARFHATLTAMIVAVAERDPHPVVALAGGCMQNVLLVEQVSAALRALGKRVLLAERVPPGDGGLALGQAWVVSRARPQGA